MTLELGIDTWVRAVGVAAAHQVCAVLWAILNDCMLVRGISRAPGVCSVPCMKEKRLKSDLQCRVGRHYDVPFHTLS